jgi:hypothetical protein
MGTLNEDLAINGFLTCKAMKIPDATLLDAGVSPAAGINPTKMGHQHELNYVQGSSSTTAAADTKVLHICYGATGTVIAFRAGCVVPCVGAATITVDFKKNGTSILGTPISLSSAQAARAVVTAALATPGLVTGDVLEVVVTATAGGGTIGTGLFAQVVIREDPA